MKLTVRVQRSRKGGWIPLQIIYGIMTLGGVIPAIVGAQSDTSSSTPNGSASRESVGGGLVARGSVVHDRPPYEREHLQTDPSVYSRYLRPGQCAVTAQRAFQFYMRDKRPDTLATDPHTDTLPDVVATVAKSCGSRFNASQLPLRDLPGMVQLSLWSKDPVSADRVTTQLLAQSSASSVSARARALGNLAAVYARATPRRYEELEALLPKFDSLSASEMNVTRQVYRLVMQDAIEQNRLNRALQFGEASIRAATRMPKADRADNIGEFSQMMNLFSNTVRLRDGTAAGLAAINRLTPDLLSARDDNNSRMMVQQWINQSKYNYDFYEKPAPPLQARHWFNTEGDTAARPKAGTVTLVYFAQQNCGAGCYPVYALLRRLHAAYHDEGLEIIMVARTNGYFRMQLQKNNAAEVETIRKYFLEFLKLPTILAVSETQFSRQMDGRRVPEPDANQRQWPQGSDMIVLDKEGRFKYLTSAVVVMAEEKVLRAQVEEALRGK